MKKHLIAAAAIALGVTATVAPTTQAEEPTLAAILTADGDRFDRNQNDFDLVTEALIATNGINGLVDAASAPGEYTVFLPTDKAFRILVEDLLGVSIKDEETLFNAIVATVGAAGVSDILLYHVVPLEADSGTVLALGDGAEIPTLLPGATFELDFKGKKPQIRLVDDGGPGRDPIVRTVDIQASNGVAHVIDRVLIPG